MKHVPSLGELSEFLSERESCSVARYNREKPPGWAIAELVINAHGHNRQTTRLGWKMLMETVCISQKKQLNI